MTEIIRELLARRPFVPFRITLTGRSTQDVTDPDWAEIDRDVLRLYRPDPAAPGGRRWAAVVSLDHVVAVDTTDADPPIIIPAGD
ncbi:MAG: hypothetical protein K2X87_11520 [Gemmataceae bacterium]|nr:hypothetical protein [Gemmataceae bacterium]